MSEEGQELGGNQAKDFNDRLDAYAEALTQKATADAEAKRIKEDAKNEGYDMKAFVQVEKLKRKGAGQIAAQLEYETIRNTYFSAAGLPADLKSAQDLARAEAASEPEAKSEKKIKNQRRRSTH